ncbi:MAG: hypothetical protein H6915_05685 [Novosphingobium sp.]|nr:hypothetical protein [Novosphingobium sp.]MCP5389239.1 hypothetical protein [Novosphingobium sp.]
MAVDEWLHKPRHEAADKFGMGFHASYHDTSADFLDMGEGISTGWGLRGQLWLDRAVPRFDRLPALFISGKFRQGPLIPVIHVPTDSYIHI